MKSPIVLMLLLCLLAAACSESEFIVEELRTYEQARAAFWRNLYPRDGVTLYCGKAFQSSQRDGINVEHVFPMSWATRALKCGKRKQCRNNSDLFNFIEADLHNLYPSRSDVNQDRSSFRFGEIKGERRAYGRQCDFEVDARARVAEPAPEVRGNVARAMFYMAHQYKEHGLEIFKKQSAMLAQWHKADPPDAAEKRRNDIIEKLQGNRNPFIDTPELLDDLRSNGQL